MFRLDIEKVVRYFTAYRRALSTRPWLFSGDAVREAVPEVQGYGSHG